MTQTTERRGRGRPPHPDVLTPSEWQVLFWLRKGLTNPRIAQRRSTGVDAVKYHVSNMLGKLALGSRDELRRWPGQPVIRARSEGDEERAMQVIEQVPMFYVQDPERSTQFYRVALGFEVVKVIDGLASVQNGPAKLVLHQADWHDGPQRGERTPEQRSAIDTTQPEDSVLMLYVDDVDAVFSDLQQRGYMDLEREEGEGSSFYLADPDGNEILVTGTANLAIDF